MTTRAQNADSLTTASAVLAASHAALLDIVRGVGADQWAAPTPCTEWNVTQVVQHAAGDQQAYVRELTGSGGPTEDPFAPSGTIDGDPVALVQRVVGTAGAAWRDSVGETVQTPLPQGELPRWVAMGAAALDAMVHAWDIAVATGQPSPLTDDGATFLESVAVQLVAPLRQWGAYGPVDEAGPGAADRLLGYLGRMPHWAP